MRVFCIQNSGVKNTEKHVHAQTAHKISCKDNATSCTVVLRLLDHDYAAHVLQIPVESQQYGNEFTVIRAMRSKRDNQATSKPLYSGFL